MNEIDMLRTEIESGERFKTVFQGYDKKQVNDTVTQLSIENASLKEQLDQAKAENSKLKKQLRDLQRELAEAGANDDAPSSAAAAAAAAAATAEAQQAARLEAAKLEERYKKELDLLKAQLRDAKAETANAKTEAANANAAAAAAEAAAAAAAAAAATATPVTVTPVAVSEKPEISVKARNDSSRFVVEDLKNEIARLTEEKRKRGLRITELEELIQQEKDTSARKIAMLNSINDNMSTILKEKLDELNDVAAEWKDAFAATTG